MKLARIVVREESVGRWMKDDGKHMFDFFRDPMAEHGYGEAPSHGDSGES